MGLVKRFLDREPIIKRHILDLDAAKEEAQVPEIHEETETAPLETVSEETEKPDTGRTFEGQTDQAYCMECIEGHILAAKTELRHALDRYRTAKEMTPGVLEKVRVAVAELQGISEDVKNTTGLDPKTAEGLNNILDGVRWIRKDFGVSGRGLTAGKGTQADLEEFRDRVEKLSAQAYDLAQEENCPECSEAVGLGYSLQVAGQLGMDAEALKKEVEDGLSTQEALQKIMTYAEEKGTADDVANLKEIQRLMYTPLSKLEEESS